MSSTPISLASLLREVPVEQVIGQSTTEVLSMTADSRQARPGTLFVAVRGTQQDGHTYIQQAVQAGSTVIVCEALPQDHATHVTYVVVQHSALALGHLAANFYGRPSEQLRLVAVTGTNGKTSTVHLLRALFSQLGYKTGMLSTIHNQIGDTIIDSDHTTPDVIQINKLLANMVREGCQYCFMEASSHALDQERMAGLQLAGAVFLNITHDHLDYHETFDAYIRAKKKLFDALPSHAFALYNASDKRGEVMMQNTHAATHSFSLRNPATFTAKLLNNTLQGLELRIDHQDVWFQLVGVFNASNLLAAYATAKLLGIQSQEALIALSSVGTIPGRFQCMHASRGFDVIIDYAHTPDALQNVLKTVHQVKHKAGRVITVVGCGGNRDKTKRPRMGHIACKLSNQVIFTADNPRYEAPEAIVRDMKADLSVAEQQRSLVILDRAEAIKAACQFASEHDVVLVAGKGHETYQEVAGERHFFDDREAVARIIA